MMLYLLLFLLLQIVGTTEGVMDAGIFKQALENLTAESLGLEEIQVYDSETEYQIL